MATVRVHGEADLIEVVVVWVGVEEEMTNTFSGSEVRLLCFNLR